MVDYGGAAAFHTAMGRLLSGTTTVHLHCEDLEMDAAGMRALAGVVGEFPGARAVLHGASPTLERCWNLLRYDVSATGVDMTP